MTASARCSGLRLSVTLDLCPNIKRMVSSFLPLHQIINVVGRGNDGNAITYCNKRPSSVRRVDESEDVRDEEGAPDLHVFKAIVRSRKGKKKKKKDATQPRLCHGN